MPDWHRIPWSGGEVEELHVRPGEPLRDALVELWLKAFQWLAAADPRHPWDTVTACVRPDSGRITLTASMGENHVPGGPPDLKSPDLEECWYDLPDPEEDDHAADLAAFDAAARTLMSDVMEDLRQALRAEPVAGLLADLRQKRPVQVVAWEFEDRETQSNLG